MKRRRYSEEFKREAVRRVLDGPASSNQISRELGIGQPTLSKWVRQFKLGGASSFSKEALAAMRKLKAENKRLRSERDILKKATVFFARQEG